MSDNTQWRDELDALSALIDQLRSSSGGRDEGEGGFALAVGLLSRIFDTFGGGGGGGGSKAPAEVEDAIKTAIERTCRVATLAMNDDGATPEERGRVDGMLKTLYYVNQVFGMTLLTSRTLSKAAADGGGAEDEAIVAGIARFSKMDIEDANKVQQLLLYLLNCAQNKGYRRLNSDCYQRLYTPEGHDTHAWERVCSMQDFVYDVTRKEINYDMWLALTSVRANVGTAVEHLANCHDVQIPDLKKDRHIFAFRDGVYLAAEDRFVRYGTEDARRLPAEAVASKYFDLRFCCREGEDAAGDAGRKEWRGIPTPHFQSILDFQDMDAEVSRWMYVMIGRLIYEVNELDRWQVLPYLKGAASSGKSTILTRVCRGLYEATDVGIMSNNIERKFGLSALHDKLMFIGPEIKSDMGLEQAEFQSIVSGETVQVTFPRL